MNRSEITDVQLESIFGDKFPQKIQRLVGEELPQSTFAQVSWIVDDRGSFALTDSLRVARFEGDSMVWRSPRISYDGIDFDALSEGRLSGRTWLLSSSLFPDEPFELDFETGELLRGQIVPE